MPWPDYIPDAQIVSARALQDDIVSTVAIRLQDPMLPSVQRVVYELIHAHAYLDRHNHAHGLLRDFVQSTGNGVGANAAAKKLALDTAWNHVFNCYNNVILPMPTLTQLTAALNGIDHGGGGVII